MGYENKPYAGLSKEEVRQYDAENEEDFLKKEKNKKMNLMKMTQVKKKQKKQKK